MKWYRYLLFFGAAATLLTCCLQSCKGGSNYRTQKIDSLARSLYGCEQHMAIDPDDIRQRHKSMQDQLGKINMLYEGGPNRDLAFMIDDMRNLCGLYRRYLEHHVALDKELDSLKKQLKALKKAAETMDDVTFKTSYAAERADVLHLARAVEEYAGAVQRAEPMYSRIAPQIAACADSLKAD